MRKSQGGSFLAAKTAFSPRRELLHPQLSPTFNTFNLQPSTFVPLFPFSTTCFGFDLAGIKPAIL